jgi:hypothetical protein
MTTRYLIGTFAAAALASAISASASTIAQVEAQSSGTAGLTLDSNPVINVIGSSPQTLDGYTYTNYGIFVQDSTGGMDLFGKLPTSSTYVPAVGDAVTATGTYAPFDQIQELGTLTAISRVSSGNPLPGTKLTTIAAIDATNNPLPSSLTSYYLELDNVTISQQNAANPVPGNFPTHGNGTYTITGGASSMELYQWASSYSDCGAFGGTTVPTTPVNITGIVDVFGSGATAVTEFVPFTITANSVPEPTSLVMLGVGAAALLGRRRRVAR